MRGGAIPIITWGFINLVLVASDWIWEGVGASPSVWINVAVTGFMLLAIFVPGLVLILSRRETIHKGEPALRREPEAVPRISLASGLVGFSLAVILFGFVFGKAITFIGGALLLFGLGRVAQEMIWQQRSLAAFRRRRSIPPDGPQP